MLPPFHFVPSRQLARSNSVLFFTRCGLVWIPRAVLPARPMARRPSEIPRMANNQGESKDGTVVPYLGWCVSGTGAMARCGGCTTTAWTAGRSPPYLTAGRNRTTHRAYRTRAQMNTTCSRRKVPGGPCGWRSPRRRGSQARTCPSAWQGSISSLGGARYWRGSVEKGRCPDKQAKTPRPRTESKARAWSSCVSFLRGASTDDIVGVSLCLSSATWGSAAASWF
jgi:hypothetical protein